MAISALVGFDKSLLVYLLVEPILVSNSRILHLTATWYYDLVLLDVMLPKLDGIEFCRQLCDRRNDTPVLLLTALDTSTSIVIGLDAGADDYLVKPFDTLEMPELSGIDLCQVVRNGPHSL